MVRTLFQFEYFVPPIPRSWSLLSQSETLSPFPCPKSPLLFQVALCTQGVFQVAHLVDAACSARVSAGGKVSYKEACARLGTEPLAQE